MLGIEDETFAGTFPFAPHYHHVNDFTMHYVDEGSGEPVVMLHGDPTWGYLYRHFIPPLSQRYRCIVPDQMGMGKSGVPDDPVRYRLDQHIGNLASLLVALDLRDITLVLHDWGGPVGMGFATRHPERIKRLILLNTWAFAAWPGPMPRLTELIRSARGEPFVLKRNGYLEPALLGATQYPERLTETVMDAYRAPFPTPASRLAMLCWSRDIPVREGDTSYAEMSRIERDLPRFADTPILLIWGMHDRVLPPLYCVNGRHCIHTRPRTKLTMRTISSRRTHQSRSSVGSRNSLRHIHSAGTGRFGRLTDRLNPRMLGAMMTDCYSRYERASP